MRRTANEIMRELNDPIPVHCHIGDPEPRLTPLAMVDLEQLHADALALIQRLDRTIVDQEKLAKKIYGQKVEAEERIQQFEAQCAEKNEKIRELCADIEEAKKKLDCWHDKLDAKIDKVEAGIVQHIQYCKQLEAELEDMTARYKIADDCAKKKGEMNEKLYAELAAVKAERDAAVKDLKTAKRCKLCKHNHVSEMVDPCFSCSCCCGVNNFEWRGVTKEE